MTRERNRRHVARPQVWGCVWGAAAALLFAEFALRPLVASWHYPESRVRTARAYTEGFGSSHFEPEDIGPYGRRLTANPEIPGAPVGIVLGDSHVVADTLEDRATMGSVLERRARSDGYPVNVRQYGWYGASTPGYVAIAPTLEERYHPAWVIVTLNFTDLGTEALTGAWEWRMRIRPDLSIELIDVRTPPPVGWRSAMRQLAGRSTLLVALRRRLARVDTWGAETPGHAAAFDRDKLLTASLRALKKAYRDKLLVAYLPVNPLDQAPGQVDPGETLLERYCKSEGVRCVLPGAAVWRKRMAMQILIRGFHNTSPGAGHLNAAGHRVIGEEIWRELKAAGMAAPAPWAR